MKLLGIILACILVASMTLAYVPGDPRFGGCVIANPDGAGQFDDVDCDRVPDVYDNCPFVANTQQVDRDQNGIGDMCDLVIDEITLEPETPMQGRSMIANVYVMNNRPYAMRNLIVRIEIPRLGISTVEEMPIIQPGARQKEELVLRIPDCAPARFTDVVALVEYPFAPGQKEVFSQPVQVPIISSGLCPSETGYERTVVDILEVQDVDPIQGATYPFTIRNMEQESKAYILTTDGLEGWGYAEIFPGSVIVVPAGEAREGSLRVHAYEGTPADEYSFVLTVSARDDIQQVLMLADVPEQLQNVPVDARFVFGFLAFLTLLIIIGLILLFLNSSHKRKIKKMTKK